MSISNGVKTKLLGIAMGGILPMVFVLGCGSTPTKTPEVKQPASTPPPAAAQPVEYEFVNRGATTQVEMEQTLGSVVAGYFIVRQFVRHGGSASGGSAELLPTILGRNSVPSNGPSIAFGEYPQSMLVNYLYKDKCVYFPLSQKANADILKTIEAKPQVCFAVDKYTLLHWWSAHIFGNAKVIKDANEVAGWLKEYEKAFGKSGFNYASKDDAVIVKVTPELLTGRKMNDTQNARYSARLPWITLAHGKADATVAARHLPMDVANVTLPKEVVCTGLEPNVVESILNVVVECRLNLLDKEYPYSIPMSIMNYKDGKVMLHSNKQGHKVECIKANPKASLDYQWFWNNSQWITLRLDGHINVITTPEEVGKALGVEPAMAGMMTQRMCLLEFVVEKATSSKIDVPLEWYPGMPGTKTE